MGRRWPPEIQSAITGELKDSARVVEQGILFGYLKGHRGGPHNITGDLIHSVSWKMGADKSKVVVGPGAKGTTWQKNPFDVTSRKGVVRKNRKTGISKMYPKSEGANLLPGQHHLRFQFVKAWWLEYGTKPHVIKGGMHPGQVKRPVIKLAWRRSRVQVRINMARAWKEAIRRVTQSG